MKSAGKTIGTRQKPLVTTKLRPPRNRGALIQRPQLIEVLRQTLNRKLAILHGPAGFGKTTLAAQWFEDALMIDAALKLGERRREQKCPVAMPARSNSFPLR